MIRIGIICPSEIAFRRFLPALKKCQEYSYVGVAVADKSEWFGESADSVSDSEFEKTRSGELEKAENFRNEYSGKIFENYASLISDPEIDAVYVPLPPALHFKWAEMALKNGKHVLVEKPSTVSGEDSRKLISLAKEKGRALHENYMFAFHDQLKAINEIVSNGTLGAVRLYRLDFGFPRRSMRDFRYSRNMGGGALLDCGGYTLKYATMLLGEDARLEYARMNYTDEFEVDLYGSAALSNKDGQVVQIGFGMDNAYKCTLEIWGSEGRLVTGRVLTAPAGFTPSYELIRGNGSEVHDLPADDTFFKSLKYFSSCISDLEIREESYRNIQKQADLVDEFRKLSEQ